MDNLVQHKNMAAGRWQDLSIAQQMGNIGSEVSRSLKNQSKPHRFKASYNRAIELFDLSLKYCSSEAKRKEIELAKFEFCDYFGEKILMTDPAKMQKYYDQFASIS